MLLLLFLLLLAATINQTTITATPTKTTTTYDYQTNITIQSLIIQLLPRLQLGRLLLVLRLLLLILLAARGPQRRCGSEVPLGHHRRLRQRQAGGQGFVQRAQPPHEGPGDLMAEGFSDASGRRRPGSDADGRDPAARARPGCAPEGKSSLPPRQPTSTGTKKAAGHMGQ